MGKTDGTSRRDWLKGIAAASLFGSAAAGRAAGDEAAVGKRLLILGGTAFLGPQIVEAAIARGFTVTLFNRGKTNPSLFPEVEKLHGDRDGHLESLRGREWDAVVDTSGYVPRLVTYVDADFLEKQSVAPWSDMPVWVPPEGDSKGFARISNARALKAGLTFRPLDTTVKDTLTWWRSEPKERREKPKAGLTPGREAEVLRAFHESHDRKGKKSTAQG